MPPVYPVFWPGLSMLNENAHPTRWRHVENAFVIKVKGAQYRNSKPFDGCLELVATDEKQAVRVLNGSHKAEVYCAWFGAKPENKYPSIIVQSGRYKLIR